MSIKKKRTFELDPAGELTPGMLVPVDHLDFEEAKRYDLGQMKLQIESSINEKVNAPASDPSDGQVIAFDGEANEMVWKNVTDIPQPAVIDASKTLTVNNSGLPEWRFQQMDLYQLSEDDITSGHLEIHNLNALSKISLTTVNNLTLDTMEHDVVNSFGVEIDNTANDNDVEISIRHGNDVLRPSIAGGTTIWAHTYVQMTCVGSCWTLAEFA